jgi:hypothetical protein
VHRELILTQKIQTKVIEKLKKSNSSMMSISEITALQDQVSSTITATSPLTKRMSVLSSTERQEALAAAQQQLRTLFPFAELFSSPADSSNADIFEFDIDMLQLQAHIVPYQTSIPFRQTFDNGVTAYIKGDWKSAKEFLDQADEMMCDLNVQFIQSPLYYPDSFDGFKNDLRTEMVLRILQRHQEQFRVSSLLQNQSISNSTSSPDSSRNINLDTNLVPGKRRSMLQQALNIASALPAKYTAEERAVLGDGPSQTLLDYMREHNFTAPDTWQGFRPLTSK